MEGFRWKMNQYFHVWLRVPGGPSSIALNGQRHELTLSFSVREEFMVMGAMGETRVP